MCVTTVVPNWALVGTWAHTDAGFMRVYTYTVCSSDAAAVASHAVNRPMFSILLFLFFNYIFYTSLYLVPI